MTTTQKFLTQLEQEAATTRKMLSVVPTNKLDWQPHPKSMTIRQLTTHIAEIPGWIKTALTTEQLDIGKGGEPLSINTNADLMAYFEKELAGCLSALQNAADEDLVPEWKMFFNERLISSRPKEEVIRMCLSQIIHHRAQLGVFLRLLDVPIPGSYGPSADEKGM